MADVKISALGAIGSVAGEDLVAIVDDPSGTPASRKATIDQIKTYIDAMTASSTATLTNKTIDAEGTGNAIMHVHCFVTTNTRFKAMLLYRRLRTNNCGDT